MGGKGSGNFSKAKHSDVERILSKSIYLVEACLDDEEIDIEKRFEIASKFALKHMPEKVELDDKNAIPLDVKTGLLESFTRLINSRMSDRRNIALRIKSDEKNGA